MKKKLLNQKEQTFYTEDERLSLKLKPGDRIYLKGHKGIHTIARLPMYKDGVINDAFVLIENSKKNEILISPSWIAGLFKGFAK